MKVLDTFLHRVLINLAVSLWWWEDFLRSQIDFRLSSSGSFFLLRIQISFLINRVFKTTNSNNCSNKILWSQSSSVGWQGNQLWGWSRVIASQPDQDATKSQENNDYKNTNTNTNTNDIQSTRQRCNLARFKKITNTNTNDSQSSRQGD